MNRVVPKPTVLLVEDEFLVREAMSTELKEAGFEVIEAIDGNDALRILAEPVDIDLLLTDIRLPGPIDGWEIGVTARRLRPDIPIIYATGYAAYHLRRMPGSIFLSKPFRGAAIREAAFRLGVMRA